MLYNLDEVAFPPCVHGRKQYISLNICPTVSLTLEAKGVVII